MGESILNYNEVILKYESVGVNHVIEKLSNDVLLILPDFNQLIGSGSGNYLLSADKLVGSEIFRHLYMEKNNSPKLFKDITQGGSVSCAYFVSNLLATYGLIDNPTATIQSLIDQLDSNDNWMMKNWSSQSMIKSGSIIFWSSDSSDLFTSQNHVGFYVDKKYAISNSSITKTIQKHLLMGSSGTMYPNIYYEKIE